MNEPQSPRQASDASPPDPPRQAQTPDPADDAAPGGSRTPENAPPPPAADAAADLAGQQDQAVGDDLQLNTSPLPQTPYRPPTPVVPDDSDQVYELAGGVQASADSAARTLFDRAVHGGRGSGQQAGLPKNRPAAAPKFLSTRLLVLAWCLWLLGSWLITLSIETSGLAVRWMIFACVLGLLVLWPALRLSQEMRLPDGGRPRVGWRVLLDWLFLNLVFQTVLWPLHLNAGWLVSQTLWIGGAMAGWSLITGAIVTLGCRSDSGVHRVVAMVLCVLLVLGEPIAKATFSLLAGPVDWTMRISPLEVLWELSGSVEPARVEGWYEPVVLAGVAGVASWVLVAVSSRWRST